MVAAGAGCMTLVLAPPCYSQEDAQLESVIVYAQKRAATLQDVPVSLSTLTGEELASAGIIDIEDLASAVPTLDLQSSVSPVTTTLRIRRVGSLGNIPTFEPDVGLFVDGAFRSRSLLGSGELLDVDHVEVLNGPQSSLYGKNVSAGVVAVYTRKPGGVFAGEAELTGGLIDAPGSAGQGRARVSLGGPISGTLGGSLAAAWSQHGTTLSNALPGGADGNDLARATLRGQLLWSPSDELELRLLGGHLRERGDQGESDVYLAPGARSTTLATALQQLDPGAVCPDNQPHDRTTCSVATNHLDLEATDLTLVANYRLANGWTITSTSSWDQYQDQRDEDDLAQLFTPLLFFHDSERGTSVQEELRLASAESAHVAWLAGVSWYANDYQRGSGGARPMFGPNGPQTFGPIWQSTLGIPLALPGQLGIHDSSVDTDYYSAFAQVAWPLGERLALDGAARWQKEDKHGYINNSVTQPGISVISVVLAPSTAPGGAPVNGSLRRSTDYFTWSLTPRFRISDDVMTWLTLARGGKSGGFNTGFGNAPLSAREFADETIDHLELGGRATILDGRMQLSATAFQTKYHDYQDAAFIAGQFSVGNADRVDLQGMELDIRTLLGTSNTASLAVSLADLTYAAHTTGMCYPGRVPDGSLPQSCDLSDEHPIDAPPWVINATLQHDHPTSWGNVSGRLDVSWTDQYNTSFSADPRLVQESYFNVGLRLALQMHDRYELVVWGDNLFDQRVANIDSVLNLFNDASYQSFLTEPRSFGMTVRTRY